MWRSPNIWNNSNRSKLHSRGSQEQIQFGEWWSPFISHSFVFLSVVCNVEIKMHRTIILTFILRGPFEKFVDLTLLLRVGTLWRCGDCLFFELPSLASDALLTTLYPLFQEDSTTGGAPFSWLEKPRNHMRRDLDCMADVLMGFHRSTFSKPNTEFNRPTLLTLHQESIQLPRHPKKGSFKTTVTQTLTTVREG
jgi:hypothetical protein